jgi:nitrogen fixation protein FixH
MKTLITIIVIIGFSAVIGAIFIGVESFDGIVTEHPYEKGLMWDEVRHKKDELDWIVQIQNRELVAGDNDVLISVLDKNKSPLAAAEVTVSISRPSTATFNRNFDIVQVREGLFSSHVNFPLFGYWDVGINVSSGGDTLLFEKRVFVRKGGKTS